MKNKITHRSVHINGREISYEWIRKKVKNINLRVRGDGTITVSSPHTISQKQIDAFLIEKASFLLHALERVEKHLQSLPPPPTFAEGDRIFLFGNPMTLRFSPLAGANITEEHDELILSPEENEEKIKKKLKGYAEKRLSETVTSLCEKIYPLFPEVERFPTIRFRTMRATWGNCRPRERILTFNTRLACYPLPCIEYVILHEFTHFLVPDHSAAFYASLSQKMPDWQERKHTLNTTQIKSFF